MSRFLVDVLVSSLLTGLSDWKNLSLDWSVLAAVVDVRGAGDGTVTEVVVVKVEVETVVREAEGLERKAV